MAGKKGMHKNSHFDGRPVQEQTKTDLRHAPVDAVVEVHPGGKLRALTYYNGKGLGDVRWVSGRFLLSFQDLWERRGDEILDRVSDEHPELVMMAQVKLAQVQRIEVRQSGDFSNLASKDEVLAKLEERSGPQARKMFEVFLKKMQRLKDDGGNDGGAG
jgi:hypothetical protein